MSFNYLKWGFVVAVISAAFTGLSLLPKNPTTPIPQPKEALRLIVKDEQGNPLKGVQIVVDSSAIPPDAFQPTNSDGYTSITLPDGVTKFRVEAKKAGYLSEEKNIDLDIKLETNRIIKLTKEKPEATSTNSNVPAQSNLPSEATIVVAATPPPKVENADANIRITSHQANQTVSFLQEIKGTAGVLDNEQTLFVYVKPPKDPNYYLNSVTRNPDNTWQASVRFGLKQDTGKGFETGILLASSNVNLNPDGYKQLPEGKVFNKIRLVRD